MAREGIDLVDNGVDSVSDVSVERSRFDFLSAGGEAVANLVLGLFSFLCVIPFIFVIVISFTDEKALAENGYRLFPEKLSAAAYKYVFESGEQLLQSFIVTIFITVVGTLLGALIMSMFSYAISRPQFKYRRFFTFLAVFTMLFSGGLVPYYMVCTQLLHLRDTIWALILPLCVNAFHIVILRTFFKTMVPESIMESASIDGATEFQTFFRIAMPIAKPGIATVALFLSLGYWNDWFQALLFIENPKLYPLQYLLRKLESSIEFIYMYSGYIDPVKRVEIIASLPTESTRMAMVVLATVPIVFAYPFFQKYFVRGLTVGSVKE